MPNTQLVYSQPPSKKVEPMDEATFQATMERLTLQKMQADVQLTVSNIAANTNHAFTARVGVYIGLLSELRQLAMAFQVDIENTILEGEPKYKFLYDGNGRDNLISAVNEIIVKLKKELEIK